MLTELCEFGRWGMARSVGVPCPLPLSLSPSLFILPPVCMPLMSTQPSPPTQVMGRRGTHQDGPHFRRDTGRGQGSGSWRAGARGGRSRAGPGSWHSGICSAGGRATVVNIGVCWSLLSLRVSFPPCPLRKVLLGFLLVLVMQKGEEKSENKCTS